MERRQNIGDPKPHEQENGTSPTNIKALTEWFKEDVEPAIIKMVTITLAEGGEIYGKYKKLNPETGVITLEKFIPAEKGFFKSSGETVDIDPREKKVLRACLRDGNGIILSFVY